MNKTVKKKVTLAKRIAKRNSAFDKASPARKRIIIAKDVIKQLELKKLIAKTGVYFVPGNFKRVSAHLFDIDTELEGFKNKELQEVIKKNTCTVCALGSMFACHIRINDNYKLSENNISKLSGNNRHTPQDEMHELLKYFGHRQLALIEIAFEISSSIGRSSGEFDEDDEGDEMLISRALNFGVKYKTAHTRLKGIMKNIIKNKGEFKP
jgi:hypothetical protein